MTAVLIWRPEPLTARLIGAARPAAAQFSALARARAPSKSIASGMFVSGTATSFLVGSRSPLAGIFEGGARPHEIEPGKKGFLALAGGRFVSGPVQHPGMPAKPFLRPLLPLWAPLYRRSAAGAFRGF